MQTKPIKHTNQSTMCSCKQNFREEQSWMHVDRRRKDTSKILLAFATTPLTLPKSSPCSTLIEAICLSVNLETVHASNSANAALQSQIKSFNTRFHKLPNTLFASYLNPFLFFSMAVQSIPA